MKKLALMTINTWRSYLLVGLAACIVLILGTLQLVSAANFSCPSTMSAGSAMATGNVTCLIAAINNANGLPGVHTINLEPGIYTLKIVDNMTDGANGLPSIKRSIQIQASADDPPTVIERDSGAPFFRIFHVSAGAELNLDGVTVQRGAGDSGGAIVNRGATSLRDSTVTDSSAFSRGAIENIGTLNLLKTVIADNFAQFEGGGIFNDVGGNVLVENSTIAHNASTDGGGMRNLGSVVIRNSAIIFNNTDCCEPGGGIINIGGSVEIVNSTIAKNIAGQGGGGVSNFDGLVSIISSTVRENETGCCGGGIENFGNGIVRVQNTIVAGNADRGFFGESTNRPDCLGPITSLGNNLVGDQSGCGINLQPSDLTGDPGLGSFIGGGEDDLPGKAFYPVLAGSAVIGKGNPSACLQTDQLGNLRANICDIGAIEFSGPMLVSVDVRPKKDANRINPYSGKDINVAIFSVNGFDATAVNANTVRFGATGTEAPPVNVDLKDIDGDGKRDMVLRFQISDSGITCGDTSAVLTAQTSKGLSITGSSPIKTVQCKKPKVSRN